MDLWLALIARVTYLFKVNMELTISSPQAVEESIRPGLLASQKVRRSLCVLWRYRWRASRWVIRSQGSSRLAWVWLCTSSLLAEARKRVTGKTRSLWTGQPCSRKWKLSALIVVFLEWSFINCSNSQSSTSMASILQASKMTPSRCTNKVSLA